MKRPRRRVEVPEGVIDDPSVAHSLVSGYGCLDPDAPPGKRRYGKPAWIGAFWREHAPELEPNDDDDAGKEAVMRATFKDPEDAAAHRMVAAWRARERQRAEFLVENGLLAGPALERALWKLRLT